VEIGPMRQGHGVKVMAIVDNDGLPDGDHARREPIRAIGSHLVLLRQFKVFEIAYSYSRQMQTCKLACMTHEYEIRRDGSCYAL